MTLHHHSKIFTILKNSTIAQKSRLNGLLVEDGNLSTTNLAATNSLFFSNNIYF